MHWSVLGQTFAVYEAVRCVHWSVLKPVSCVKLWPWHRYEKIKQEQAAKLQDSHERSMRLLKSQERPFSFYGKALAKEEAAKQYKPPSAKDFQKPFKANPVPKSSLEVRCLSSYLVSISRLFSFTRASKPVLLCNGKAPTTTSRFKLLHLDWSVIPSCSMYQN